MLFRSFLLASLVSNAIAQAPIPFAPAISQAPIPFVPIPFQPTTTETPGSFPVCSVCGPGLVVSNPNAVITIPNVGQTTCEVFQRAGFLGFVEPEICTVAPTYVAECGCVAGDPAPPPIQAPFRSPAPVQPISPPIPPSPGFPVCSVCGPGLVISNPQGIITLPGIPPTTCELTQLSGILGFIDPQFCPFFAEFVLPDCDCIPGTFAPSPSPATRAPANASPATRAPANASPIASPLPPSPGFPFCSLCGPGLAVTNPQVVIDIPTVPPSTCGLVQRAGRLGFIEPEFCAMIPEYAAPCGCAPSAPNLAPSVSQPIPPTSSYPICSVCGPGLVVTNPQVVITILRQPPRTCADVERAGVLGLIDPQSCPFFPQFTSPCGCAPGTFAPITTPPPVTANPVPPPSPGFPVCSVCGPGLVITNPEVIITILRQPPRTCADVQRDGILGFIDPQSCPFFPQFTAPCGCVPGTFAPISTLPPGPTISTSPVQAPSPVPPSPGFPVCSVCGPGLVVSNPEAIVIIDGTPQETCEIFERAGILGFIEPALCPLFEDIVTPFCDCISGTFAPSTSPETRPPQSRSPVNAAPIPPPVPPSPGFPVCSVCGPGMVVTTPQVIIAIPTSAPTTCAEFERAGILGFIDPQFCPIATDFAAPCGCAPGTFAPGVSPETRSPSPVNVAPITPPSPGFPVCSVCGPGLVISNPEAIVIIDGTPQGTCEIFERAGMLGFIEPALCPLFEDIVTPFCDCIPGTFAPSTSPETRPPQSRSPVNAAPIPPPVPPSPGFPICSVCGPGMVVTNPEGVVMIPTQPPTTCASFQRAGMRGFIDPQFCPIVPGFAGPCGCSPGTFAPSSSPPSVSPETRAPVRPPVPQPIFSPVPPSPGFPICSVCGPGMVVTNPRFLVVIPTQPPTTCANFQRAGKLGFIDPQSCPIVTDFAGPCGCAPGTFAPSVSPEIRAPDSAAPFNFDPVSPAPITAAPNTAAPFNTNPVSPAPITAAPVTRVPSSSAPNTPAPIVSPITLTPVTLAPVDEAPVADEMLSPVTAAPVVVGTPSPSMAPVSEPMPVADEKKKKKKKEKNRNNKGSMGKKV